MHNSQALITFKLCVFGILLLQMLGSWRYSCCTGGTTWPLS